MAKINHSAIKVQYAQETRTAYREILIVQEGDYWLEYFTSSRGHWHSGPCIIELSVYPSGGVNVEVIPGTAVEIPEQDGEYEMELQEGDLFLNKYGKGSPTVWWGPRTVRLGVEGGKVESVYIIGH